jgi:hypothetical protein
LYQPGKARDRGKIVFVFEFLFTLVSPACDDLNSRVLQEWLRDQPAIVRPVRDLGAFDWAGCTTSSSVYASVWTGDVPVTLTAAVSDDIIEAIKPLPQFVRPRRD